MEKFIVDGGRTLSGMVEISGAKNSVLPIMAAKYSSRRVFSLIDSRAGTRLLPLPEFCCLAALTSRSNLSSARSGCAGFGKSRDSVKKVG